MKSGHTYIGRDGSRHVVVGPDGKADIYTDNEMREVHGIEKDNLRKLEPKTDGERVKGIGKFKGSEGTIVHSEGDSHYVLDDGGDLSKYSSNEMKELYGYGVDKKDNTGGQEKKKIKNGIQGLPYLIHRGNPTIKEGKEMIGEYHDIDNSKTSFDGGGNPTYFDKKGRKIGTHDKKKGKIHVYHY